uniref:Calcium uniporter protein n=1 Tax=Salmo trutta TaxID=8032 RepID=A0A674EW96_SALTR
LVLSCPHLSCLVLSYPVLSYPHPSSPVLSCPVLSYPVLSSPVLSCPNLSCLVLSCPILSCPIQPVLSYPHLSCPVLSPPVLSCPHLFCPVLPVLSFPVLSPSCPVPTYPVLSCPVDLLAQEEAERLNDVKSLVQQLYTTLRIEEHQLSKEKELVVRLEDLNSQLRPLEKVREELSRKAERRTTWVLWGGVAYMATQFGILARLTWWEYSWDIMEPVTYFITYATAMAIYSYYVLTRQEYIYPDARDRQYLLFFHKGVKRQRFDVHKYNQLKDSIAEVGTNPSTSTTS